MLITVYGSFLIATNENELKYIFFSTTQQKISDTVINSFIHPCVTRKCENNSPFKQHDIVPGFPETMSWILVNYRKSENYDLLTQFSHKFEFIR